MIIMNAPLLGAIFGGYPDKKGTSRDGYPSFIKRFGSKADFVVPVHGERVECEIAEIF